MKLATLALFWDRGNRWFLDRSLRERALLAVLATLAMLALLIVAVLHPIEAARTRAIGDIRTFDRLSARLQAIGPGQVTTRTRHGASSTIVSETAAASGLTISRVEPEGGGLRVTLADAPFDKVIGWTAALEQTSALRVSEARIERGSGTPGTVASSFMLSQ